MCEIRRWTAGALQCVERIVLLCVCACVFSQFVCTSSPEEKTQINTSSWNRQRWSLAAVTAVGAHLVHQATSSIFFKELVCDARDGGCIRHTVSGPHPPPKKPIVYFHYSRTERDGSVNRVGVGADRLLISTEEEDIELMHRVTKKGEVI